MAEPMPYDLTAVQADGFIDFYQLLGVPSSAPSDELRERIQVLYAESQANRDHRNLNKRRDYQALLEYLPQARSTLLDEEKRQRYDNYVAEVRSGGSKQTFEAFMAELSGQVADTERTDVLGIQENAARATVTTRAASTSTTSTGSTPSSKPARKPQVQSNAQQGVMGSAIAVIVFAVTLAVLYFLTTLPVAVGVAAVAGVITWFATRPRGGGRIAR